MERFAHLGGEDDLFSLNILNFKCLWEFQVEMSNKQLYIEIWTLGEGSGLQVWILKSLQLIRDDH